MDNLRWLHLSDFHIGKDNYGQIKLFKYILRHIKENKEKGYVPDIIFITGDIAHSGMKEQYDMFANEFLLELVEVYDHLPKIYIVPGNHDLDRTKCVLAAGKLYDVINDNKTFFDPDPCGLNLRKEIFDRFKNFENNISEDLCFPVKDIFGEKACFSDVLMKENKRIGIVGVNTAWLANSSRDKESLTPGKFIIEDALEAVKDCEYKFVLGHHPLSWFENNQRKQISALFAKSKAIYLHGHMHKNSGEYALPVNTGFLSLQCGAAFQAREDEKYYNSLQWGELDFDNATVSIMPKRWSAMEQVFILDSSESLPDAFREEGSDRWRFPLSFAIMNNNKKCAETQVKIPFGWRVIDKDFIKLKMQKLPSDEEILKYFDGREPSYSDVFSPLIPVRDSAFAIQDEFVKCNGRNKMKCALITGAGGEGKTTVLLQIVRILVEENSWKGLVLNQPEKDMQVLEEQIINFTREGVWVIAVDNCSLIIEKIFSLMKRLVRMDRSNVHFLLCARDIDWNNSEANKLQWGNFSDYSTFKLRGINEKDAEKIVAAWEKLGDGGLGKLKGMSGGEAKAKLVLSSKNEEKNEPSEGALLGAMLSTRYGDELNNHVRKMLLRLKTVPLYNGTLLDAFAYITAMHSEKFYFLSKAVLAQVYNCKLKAVKKDILGPLGDEAASAVSGDIIFTRHLSIARAARKILDEEFHYDFDEIFIELTTAAIEAWQKGEYIESLGRWRYISKNFVNKNNSLAIGLDKEILKLDTTDTFTIVHLSKLYRMVEQPDLAEELFRNINYVIEDRPFFCEWALVEANQGNKAASICLSAVALSDQAEKRSVDVKNACINLYSIAITFLELHRLLKDNTYLLAAKAAIILGQKIDCDDLNIKKFVSAHTEMFQADDLKISDRSLYQCLQKGILAAAGEKEFCFMEWIPKAEILEYKRLFKLAGIVPADN